MFPQSLLEPLKSMLAQRGFPTAGLQVQPVGGGSINHTFKLTFSNAHAVFCKVNNAAAFPNLFAQERIGLLTLQQTKTFRTPQVILQTELAGFQLLLLEWIEPAASANKFFTGFGEQLAALHQHTHDRFGWHHDNYMGSVPQQNTAQQNWCTFFQSQRLEPLLQQAHSKNLLPQQAHEDFKKLFEKLPQFFDDGEAPALLHGDLWSGNFICAIGQHPVLIDPAVYYGHRCMDIAMTTLFGGFDASLYEAYHYHFPLPATYNEQLAVCNLYPLLIHLLLFGKSYLTSIQQTLRQFV